MLKDQPYVSLAYMTGVLPIKKYSSGSALNMFDEFSFLKATLNKDEAEVLRLIHHIHNSEIPILQYNDENSLSCVISLAYLSAREIYRIEREEKTGKGYADFTFHPKRKSDTAIIVELKKNETAQKAIEQIKDKEYVQKFKNENNKILAVAICYDFNNKEHSCKIEEIS